MVACKILRGEGLNLKLMVYPVFVVLAIVTFISVWHIDVCFGAMSIGGCVTNGVICEDPMLYFHHHLRILIACLLLTFSVTAFLIGILLNSKPD